MNKKSTLPAGGKQPKINLKEFVALAKRVRKSFEEEAQYWEKHKLANETNPLARFLIQD